jgi:phenylacetate-CoA ligase
MPLPQPADLTGPDDIRAIQQDRLLWTVRQARRSPFYGRLLDGVAEPTSLDDLPALPQTTKAHLRDQYPFGLLAVPRRELATYHESSGTTGEPSPSYYTEADWVDLAERFARKSTGLSADDTLLVRAPYALPLTGHLAHAGGRLRGALVVPGDLRSTAMPYARVVRVLHDLDVTVTWSLPTEMLLVAAAARVAGYQPGKDFPVLRAILAAGEPMTPSRRSRIERLWGVPVEEEYGSTETGTLAGDCPEGRLHLWTDRVIAEVYDPATGRSSAEGRGQLVITTLFREAMPLIRYNLEDTVEVAFGCPCGWPFPTIAVEGRTAFAYPVGDAVLTQQVVEDIVFGLPDECGVLFWRARAEPDRLVVELEVDPDQAANACAAFGDLVDRDLGVPASVSAIPPGTLVSLETLAASPAVVKPRSLFGPQEDWSRAVTYF